MAAQTINIKPSGAPQIFVMALTDEELTKLKPDWWLPEITTLINEKLKESNTIKGE